MPSVFNEDRTPLFGHFGNYELQYQHVFVDWDFDRRFIHIVPAFLLEEGFETWPLWGKWNLNHNIVTRGCRKIDDDNSVYGINVCNQLIHCNWLSRKLDGGFCSIGCDEVVNIEVVIYFHKVFKKLLCKIILKLKLSTFSSLNTLWTSINLFHLSGRP